MPGTHRVALSRPWRVDVAARVQRLGCSTRGHLARWLSDFTAYWNRQPLDRFWPPHP
jgi:hypothetical protein